MAGLRELARDETALLPDPWPDCQGVSAFMTVMAVMSAQHTDFSQQLYSIKHYRGSSSGIEDACEVGMILHHTNIRQLHHRSHARSLQAEDAASVTSEVPFRLEIPHLKHFSHSSASLEATADAVLSKICAGARRGQ